MGWLRNALTPAARRLEFALYIGQGKWYDMRMLKEKERGTEMASRFDRYLENMEEASRLVKPEITPQMSDETLLTCVQEDAVRRRQLCMENDVLLKELVLSRRAEDLTREDVEELRAAAARLFHFNRSVDVGAAYRIHKLLYAYARLHNDRDGVIRELYNQGITLFYLNFKSGSQNINVFEKEINGYFYAGAAYIDEYWQIQREGTRSYIIRCMANRNLTIQRELNGDNMAGDMTAEQAYGLYRKNFEETMAIIQSPAYRAANPKLPWDSFAYSLHADRVSFLAFIRKKPSGEMIEDVLESAEYVYAHRKHQAQERDAVGVTPGYAYAAAQYHAGRITAEELVKVLLSEYKEARPMDFSLSGIRLNIVYPQYLEAYSQELPPEQREKYQSVLKESRDNFWKYLLALPRNEYINKVARSLRSYVLTLSEENDPRRDRQLDTILACHAPTYIHSIMVAWLNRKITAQLLKTAPEALEGAFGYTGAALLENGEKICAQAYTCGLYHDLGKSMIINYIGIYGRRLLDEEFECVKYHPALGYSLLSAFPDRQVSAMTALHHHRGWDGQSGYPRICPACPPEARAIACITTVSDCMDAATDDIGRSYVIAKKYDTLVEELFQRRGTYYAPEIVDLFRDPGFRESLGRELREKRRKIYCQVYRELAEWQES